MNRDEIVKCKFTNIRKQSRSKMDGSSGNAGLSSRKPSTTTTNQSCWQSHQNPYSLKGTEGILSELTLLVVSLIHFQASLVPSLYSTAGKTVHQQRKETCLDSVHYTLCKIMYIVKISTPVCIYYIIPKLDMT